RLPRVAARADRDLRPRPAVDLSPPRIELAGDRHRAGAAVGESRHRGGDPGDHADRGADRVRHRDPDRRLVARTLTDPALDPGAGHWLSYFRIPPAAAALRPAPLGRIPRCIRGAGRALGNDY